MGQALTPGLPHRYVSRKQMKASSRLRAALTDSHFLIPLAVFTFGLALLIAMR